MTLGELIKALKKDADPDRVVPIGFGENAHLYRANHYALAFEPHSNVSVRSMLSCAETAVGKFMQKNKIDLGTEVWIAKWDEFGELLTPMGLKYMLSSAGQTPIKQGTEWDRTQRHGRCFFCLECICGWRAIDWDVVFQAPVCGPCLLRVRWLQENVYSPREESLYEKVGYGDWATDVARKWATERSGDLSRPQIKPPPPGGLGRFPPGVTI